jgi:hypothetical protein
MAARIAGFAPAIGPAASDAHFSLLQARCASVMPMPGDRWASRKDSNMISRKRVNHVFSLCRLAIAIGALGLLAGCGNGGSDGAGGGSNSGGGSSQSCEHSYGCVNGSCTCSDGPNQGGSCCDPEDTSCSGDTCDKYCNVCG